MKKLILNFALFLQIFFGLLGYQGTANAQTQQKLYTYNVPVQMQPIDNLQSPLLQRLKLSMGDARYVKNASGAVVLQVPAGEAADVLYTKLGSTPQVWAAYSAGSATGRIQVLRAMKKGAMIEVAAWDFTPEGNGAKVIADGYHNVDPYASFAGGDGLWHNLSFQAFLAVTGKAMAKNRTAISYVALAELHQDVQTSSSGSLLKSSSSTIVTSYVKPHWYFGTAIENGGAQAFATAYTIPGCNALTDPRKCIVQGGVAWVSMTGGNMHEEKYLADQQVQTVSSWTFIAMIAFTFVMAWAGTALLAGAAGTGGAGMAAATGSGAGMSAVQVASIAASAYGGISAVQSGGVCLTCAQGSWLGQVSSGVQAPSPGGFGDPSAAIHNSFVAPGVNGGLQAGQAAMLNQTKPKIWNSNHDPAYMQNNPPMRSGVMQGYMSSPIPH